MPGSAFAGYGRRWSSYGRLERPGPIVQSVTPRGSQHLFPLSESGSGPRWGTGVPIPMGAGEGGPQGASQPVKSPPKRAGARQRGGSAPRSPVRQSFASHTPAVSIACVAKRLTRALQAWHRSSSSAGTARVRTSSVRPDMQLRTSGQWTRTSGHGGQSCPDSSAIRSWHRWPHGGPGPSQHRERHPEAPLSRYRGTGEGMGSPRQLSYMLLRRRTPTA